MEQPELNGTENNQFCGSRSVRNFHVSGRRRLEDVAFEASGLPISGWSAPALWIGYIPMFNGQLLSFT